jgi:hypothetical protein
MGRTTGNRGVWRLFAPLLLLALLLPASAVAKNSDAPVYVLWNSKPAGLRAGSAWDARISVMREPGGLDIGHLRPVLVVTNMATGATQRVRTTVDIPPNTFKALVRFTRAGDYSVTATHFHPSRQGATANLGHPVSVAPPPAAPVAHQGIPWWPFAAAGAIVLAWLAWRRRAAGRAAPADV